MRSISIIIPILLLLSLGSVLFFAISTHSHSETHVTHQQHTMSTSSDCPFMVHGETICPMTVLDHLGVLRSIFETVLPNIVTLLLMAGLAVGTYFCISRHKPLHLLHAHTFSKWRTSVLYEFSYKLHQSLFSRGILHSKLFS